MQVFLSWSGNRSHLVAEVLQSWLRQVIQATEPWISADIEKGTRWSAEIADRLENSNFGILCLTKENLDSKWIHFEAGALAKHKTARTCTLLLDIQPTDVQQPLGQFQHTTIERHDVLKLVQAINSSIGRSAEKPLPDDVLTELFDNNWERLEAQLKDIQSNSPEESQYERPERELLEEALEILRNQERRHKVKSVEDRFNDLNSWAAVVSNNDDKLPDVAKYILAVRDHDNLKNNDLYQYILKNVKETIEKRKDDNDSCDVK